VQPRLDNKAVLGELSISKLKSRENSGMKKPLNRYLSGGFNSTELTSPMASEGEVNKVPKAQGRTKQGTLLPKPETNKREKSTEKKKPVKYAFDMSTLSAFSGRAAGGMKSDRGSDINRVPQINLDLKPVTETPKRRDSPESDIDLYLAMELERKNNNRKTHHTSGPPKLI